MRPETLFEQLFFTTVHIQPYEPTRSGGGTAFIYQVPVGPGEYSTFLVTNKHVVFDVGPVSLRFLIAGDGGESVQLGREHNLEVLNPARFFVGHPRDDIDIAVAALSTTISDLHAVGIVPFFRSIGPSVMLDKASLASIDALEPVTFIGYPSGLYDRVNFLPVARRGYTATPPSIDFEGRPSFLIDASVFPGSSGSPVFIAEAGELDGRAPGRLKQTRLILLGVLSGAYEQMVPVDGVDPEENHVVSAGLNIGLVFKASLIDEVVDAILAAHKLKRFPETLRQPGETPIRAVDAGVDPLAN